MSSVRSILPFLAMGITACGAESASEAVPPLEVEAPSTGAPAAVLRDDQRPLSDDSRVRRMARALETRDERELADAVLGLDPELGLDHHLLRARWLALRDDVVELTHEIEAARAGWPDQGRVYACAAEIHAAAGRLDAAQQELDEGLAKVGPTPELLRAQGVVALSTPGRAAAGLAALLRAREAVPDLPFSTRITALGHLLVGRQAVRNGALDEAELHAAAGLALLPDHDDLHELEAEIREARGDFAGAIPYWEDALAAGRDCAGTLALLHQRAATQALVEQGRERALWHYQRARALGLSDEELGFGKDALRDEAERSLEQGFDAWERDDFERAALAFERALELEPAWLEAHNHLAKALFRLGRYDPSVEHFEVALRGLVEAGEPLPEPVHLNLARALFQSGRADEVRALCEAYLEREPDGAWVEATEEMLERL